MHVNHINNRINNLVDTLLITRLTIKNKFMWAQYKNQHKNATNYLWSIQRHSFPHFILFSYAIDGLGKSAIVGHTVVHMSRHSHIESSFYHFDWNLHTVLRYEGLPLATTTTTLLSV